MITDDNEDSTDSTSFDFILGMGLLEFIFSGLGLFALSEIDVPGDFVREVGTLKAHEVAGVLLLFALPVFSFHSLSFSAMERLWKFSTSIICPHSHTLPVTNDLRTNNVII